MSRLNGNHEPVSLGVADCFTPALGKGKVPLPFADDKTAF